MKPGIPNGRARLRRAVDIWLGGASPSRGRTSMKLMQFIAMVRENPLYVYLAVAIVLAFLLVIAAIFATVL